MRLLAITTAAFLLFAGAGSASSQESATVVQIREVPEMTEAELIASTRGECTNPPDCEGFRRRQAVKRLAREFPSSFLGLARELYDREEGLSVAVAEAYWEHRVSELPENLQMELLWEIFHGNAEGLISASEYRAVKSFAVQQLCERGTHDRFKKLRDHLTSSWTSIDTVTEEVSFCKDRYDAVKDYGSKFFAGLAMLEGKANAKELRTQFWALRQAEASLQDSSDAHRERVKHALVLAALRWLETDDYYDTGYSHAYVMLSREFNLNSLQLRELGLTGIPASP